MRPGMRLVFADDFDRPHSVSRDGIGANVEIAVEHVAGKGWPGVAGVQILPRSRAPSP